MDQPAPSLAPAPVVSLRQPIQTQHRDSEVGLPASLLTVLTKSTLQPGLGGYLIILLSHDVERVLSPYAPLFLEPSHRSPC